MPSIFEKCIATRAILVLALILPVSAAAAAPETFVIVPDAPGGRGDFAGCYRAERDLYGPYRLTMCFERSGTYRIRGGARCDGTLTWRVSGRDIRVELHRASCANRVAWARANVECRGSGSRLESAVRELAARLTNRNLPRIRTLNCTYRPTVPGYQVKTFRATRN
jgi:hypothetical protein